MDQLERAQIRLILEHLGVEISARSAERQKAMHAEHAAKGLLRSGKTVKVCLRIAEELAREYVNKAIDQVSAVAQDIDAFAMIVSSLTATFRYWEAELAEAVRLAGGGGEANTFASIQTEANRLFAEMRTHVLRELEIHRFSFTKPSRGSLVEMRSRLGSPTGPGREEPTRKNVGGKPLAKHWDDMWASVAVSLWSGDLKPASQAEVMQAMFDWFTANGLEVGETAVRQRARQLWQKIEASG